MVQLIETSNIHHNDLHNQPIKSTNTTKDITEILTILDKHEHCKFILIEGFPGMGKTILSKQIAYMWAKAKTFKFVFLVNLQDPKVHQLKSLPDLLHYFCKEKSWPIRVTESSEHIAESCGKDVAFLFDGFDKFPLTSRGNSFICKVIRREVLPNCTLLVSSCPHASARLRHEATVRVYLLGFSETEQKEYIEEKLKDQAQSQKIVQYLEHDTMIRNFCSVPFTIAALLFLYDQNCLFTSNYLEIYNHLICLTICRHLAKHGYSFEKKYDLTNLPDAYNKIITQLGKLSIESLKIKKTTFTFADIKETCPDVVPTSGLVEGLGLLQAVQHDCITGHKIEFSFTHLLIREFLAAYYIRMSDNQMDCISLFNWFYQENKRDICRIIANSKIFDDRTISLRNKKLLPSNVENLTCFLVHSYHKEFEEVDANGCGIQDEHIETIHQGLMGHSITIKRLSLTNNKFTESSSSKIIDIAIHCKVEVLSVRSNFISTIYKVLSNPNSVVKELYMSHTNFKNFSTTTELFSALENNKMLRALRISNNNVTDNDIRAIVKALKSNNHLVELTMFHNSFSIENALKIVRALAHNTTLNYLVLPWYSTKDQKRITKVAKKIDKKRNCTCRLDLFCYPK